MDKQAFSENAMKGRTFSFNTFQITLRLLIGLSMQALNLTVFPMIAVSLDAKVANVSVCIPISTLTLSGIASFFSGKKQLKKVTVPPSPKVPVRLW